MNNRKVQHIEAALNQEIGKNSFDDMILNHYSIPKYNYNDIDISTVLTNFKIEAPFFINAMTGGSLKSKEINEKLAYIANKTKIPLASGSYSPALKDEKYKQDYLVIKEKSGGIFISNIGVDKDYTLALKTLSETKCDILQIHLNTLQELIMAEGETNFNEWKNNLIKIKENIKIPLIIKEVGFGMSEESIAELLQIGFDWIDISGFGGTNFAYIENLRIDNKMQYLNNWGISTVISLINSQKFQDKANFIASGGIRNPLDIVKSLILGAKCVGISGHILKLLEKYDIDKVVDIINSYKIEIKKIMCLLNCKNINELKNVKYYFINETYQILTQKKKD